MVLQNKLEFGYGDIAVGLTWDGLVFTQIKPPVEVGTDLTGDYTVKYDIEFGDKIKVMLELSDIDILINNINKVTPSNHTFQFRDVIFDFSNYNKDSINVVLRSLKKLSNTMLYILPYAC